MERTPAATLIIPQLSRGQLFIPVKTRLHTVPTVHPSQTRRKAVETIEAVDAESLIRSLREFLAASRHAAVLEDGVIAFDLSSARYSVSGEHGKCLLHFWSAERNIVRRVLAVESKNNALRLTVQRLGQPHPSKLEICRDRDGRSTSMKRTARAIYRSRLQRILERIFPGWTLLHLSTAMDLERSFGPIYTRGLLRRGRSAFAVLGVNTEETQVSIDAALTFGILWLDICRQTHATELAVEGLKLFVPRGCSALVRERIAHLNHTAAKWHLFEFHERDDSVREIDSSDRGNVLTRLVQCPEDESVLNRFADAILKVRMLLRESEVGVISSAEIAFRLHGLEFARARVAHEPGSFRSATEIVFGLGAEERVLSGSNLDDFSRLLRQAGEVRHEDGPRDHPLFRMHPERWLESLMVKAVSAVDSHLNPACVYSQVPAFSVSDRSLIDVLACTSAGRLAVLELKADEDIHLPLQGLDYWARVKWHHDRGDFQKNGYFKGVQLSSEPPLLYLISPSLRVHPAVETILRYFSPYIQWTLAGLDDRWRQGIRVVFRKASAKAVSA